MRAALIVVTALVVLALAPIADAKKFANCTALNKTYKGGIAKTKAAQQKAIVDGAEYTPIVNAKVYAENASKDRDKDGVACEK